MEVLWRGPPSCGEAPYPMLVSPGAAHGATARRLRECLVGQLDGREPLASVLGLSTRIYRLVDRPSAETGEP